MMRGSVGLAICCMLSVMWGCVSPEELAKVDTRLKKLEGDVNRRLKISETSVKSAMGRLEAAEKAVEAMKNQVEANKNQAEANRGRATLQSETVAKQQGELKKLQADVAKLQGEFRNVRLLMEQGQEMFLKNMEQARDIYKRQYLALDQIIEEVKQSPEPEPPKPAPPKPEKMEEKKPAKPAPPKAAPKTPAKPANK